METEFLGDKRCPVCGKRFTVLWPHQWAYKRGKPNAKYYCSWKCLRTLDNEKGDDDQVKRGKLTLEQKKRAVQIALDGGDPLKYLKDHGAGNPAAMWYTIKQNVKDTDPETYRKIPDLRNKSSEPTATLADAMTGMQDAADEFFGKCEEMGLKVNEKETIWKPAVQPAFQDDDYTVTAIRHKTFGEFYHDTDHDCIDWRTLDGDEMSMSVKGWKMLISELPAIMKRLGVEA